MRLGLLAVVTGMLLASAPAAQAAVRYSLPSGFPAGASPTAIAVGQFNGDSDPDLAVANGSASDPSVSILLGSTGGGFTGATNFAAGATPSALAVGDFDGDGNQDLAVTNRTSNTVSVLLGAGTGSFGAPVSHPVGGTEPASVAVADFNGDSDPDLAVANQYSDSVSILLGAAGGGFDPSTTLADSFNSLPSEIAAGDFNGDADPDLAVAHTNSSLVSIWLGSAGAGFGPASGFEAGNRQEAIVTGDFNGDSDPDLAVANNQYNTVTILVGGAGGSFGPAGTLTTGNLPESIAVADLDGNADPDLAVANDASADVSVFLGAGGASFSAGVRFPPGPFARGDPESIAVADFDADSMPDLATATRNPDEAAIMLQLEVEGYPRPRSATPIQMKLVPAFSECTSPNAVHGAPLAVSSCSPPGQVSTFLTLNAEDRSPPFNTSSGGTGSVRMKVFCTDGAPPPCKVHAADQQDVQIDSTISDVRCALVGGGCPLVGGTYSGKLLLRTTLRITDRWNGSSFIQTATATDFPLEVGMQCSAGSCNTSTSADAIFYGVALEGKRAIWGLGRLEVLDGGPDGDLVDADPPATGSCPPACGGNGGEAVFLHQGLFVP